MGNAQSVSLNFLSLLSPKQRQILELRMRHESISWANVLVKLYPEIKDKEYLSNLIDNYKNSTNVPLTPALLNQEMPKRQKTVVMLANLKTAAVPNLSMTNAHRQLFAAILAQLPDMHLAPIKEQTTAGAAGTEQCGF